jgi:hypothetical protein
MACRTCLELLNACKRSVTLFTEAERNMRGLLGDDFQVAMNELQRLHRACMDANGAVTAHWQQEHQRVGA